MPNLAGWAYHEIEQFVEQAYHEEDVRRAWRAVYRGSDLMDSAEPMWFREIDESKLELATDCGCILGQTFHKYTNGLEQLGLNSLEAVRHGFLGFELGHSRWGGNGADGGESGLLTMLWTLRIRQLVTRYYGKEE